MKKKVLVFPCGSEISLEINRALAHSIHFDLYGASSVFSNHGKYVYKNYIDGLPFVNEENFFEKLNELIEDLEIDYLFPAHDSVYLEFSQKKHLINCKVISSPFETWSICRSKRKTYEYFKNDLEVPKIYNSDNNYPIFLKPDIGQGAKGTYKVNSLDEVKFYQQIDETLISMEYLPGKEFTIDCFTDKNRELIFVGGRERKRIMNGISVDTSPVYDKRFNEIANIINEKLTLKGSWFFQVKERENKELVLMEIEPRVAGSMGLYRNLGVNFPILTLFTFEDKDVEIILNNNEIKLDRALINRYMTNLQYRTVYMDLDDTILINGKINLQAITFIYQCFNNDIKVHLITRHAQVLSSTLKNYHLENLFDSHIWVKEGDEKYKYITENSSIFIDDSFRERKMVKEQLGIPTFDVSSIESLLDWRV